MRPFLISLFAAVASQFLGAIVPASAASSLWQPKPRPQTCQAETVQVITIDTSGSMRNHQRFIQVQHQLNQFVRSQSFDKVNCQHVILIRFDTTADVVADDYLIGAANRDRILAALSKLKPEGEQTNFDEAAKQIRLVALQLSQNSTVPESFHVSVLTDGQPEPSVGKTSFDLTQFLRREFSEATLSWGMHRATKQRAIQTLSDKKPLITASANRNSVTVSEKIEVPKSIPQSPPSSSSNSVLWLISVPIVLGGLVFLSARKPTSTRPLVEPVLNPVQSLLVTELDAVSDRSIPNRAAKTVWLSPEIPVKFGTKAEHHYVIKNLGSIDVLFSITATSSGMVHLETSEALRCNESPVPPEGLTLPGDRSFQVQYKHRTWHIDPSHQKNAPKQLSYFIQAASH